MIELHRQNNVAFKDFSRTLDGEKGTAVFGENRLFLNPMRLTRYKDASEYLQDVVLNNPTPFQEGVNETIEIIKNSHYLLTHGLPSPETYRPGTFREVFFIFYRDDPEPLTKSDLKIFSSLKINNSSPVISDEQMQTLRKKYVVPPFYEMMQDIEKFAETLAGRLLPGCATIDYVDLASYAHHEIMRIQPFNRGCGRLARLLLNTILKLGGHPEVVFFSRNYYTVAFHDQKTFTNYLMTEIARTERHKASLKDTYTQEN